ncbi:tRNA modification GTPase [Desulfitispora alkaliphila]|uniref:tRNA uridine-5-carboxymethylaminomethyl(34) synthesis GTPase MnmE n=1 Tax=Desulfitispora alkaliphila TaxID=622674 RepID=UPI003D2275FE
MSITDTISAIATPLGEGSIGIVRLSGSEAKEILAKIFKPTNKSIKALELNSHTVYHGYIVEENDQVVDEVLVTYMQGPRTFTREDVVEISCHGGVVPLNKILKLTLTLGSRLAEPGEFTKRAFLNGRIDLAQAESIIDVIRAKTDAGLKVAVNQLEGKLSEKIVVLRNDLVSMLAQVEANIDFPEEDIAPVNYDEFIIKTENLLKELNLLAELAEEGKVYREGLKTAIVGKPNVGKSSLLNALAKENRAIVTDIPGTTRDVIEEIINLRGIPLKLMDTAGIRKTEDLVEKIGVKKSEALIKEADLVLVIIDINQELSEDDLRIIEAAKDKNSILVMNKVDINEKGLNLEAELAKKIKTINEIPIVTISAKEKIGLGDLGKTVEKIVRRKGTTSVDNIAVSNTRHQALIKKSIIHLGSLKHSLKSDMAVDFLSIDISSCYELLGEIIGETVGEDLIDQIFADFCLGK